MDAPILPPSVLENIRELLNISEELMEEILNDPVFDKCLGSIYGAMFGDALGSYCQFEKKIKDSTMETVMKMPGGGTFTTSPGQVTDDSEMALHMLEALKAYDIQKQFDENISTVSIKIATQYIRWAQSRPFDIGNTCSGGINSLFFSDVDQGMGNLRNAFIQIAGINGKSLSNGYMMRNTPMVIFNTIMTKYQPQNRQKMNELIENEIKMTHSHKSCLQSGRQWVHLLTNIILRKEDQSLASIYEQFDKKQCQTKQFKEWKEEAKQENFMISTINEGFVKIAISFGLHHFRNIAFSEKKEEELNGNLYKTIIADVIQRGGDTDTNAAIVGGLLGGIIGFRKLPIQYKQIQMNLRLKKGNQLTDRPSFYEPRYALYNTLQLFKKFIKK